MKVLQFSIFLLFCVSLALSKKPLRNIEDVTYYQPIPKIFLFEEGGQIADWGNLPFNGPIIQVANGVGSRDSFILLEDSLWYLDQLPNETITFTQVMTSMEIVTGMRIRRNSNLLTNGQLIIAGPEGVYQCAFSLPKTLCNQIAFNFKSNINDVILTAQGNTYIGSEFGLYFLGATDEEVLPVPGINDSINAVAFDDTTGSVVAGGFVLWRQVNPNGSWHFFRTPGIIDAIISTMAFDANGILHIGNEICINIQYPNLTFERIGWAKNLITTNITSIAISNSGNLWYSTLQGVMRYTPEYAQRKYFYGARWLPGPNFKSGQSAASIAVLYGGLETAIIATDGGLSIITYEAMTLSAKAEYYQEIVCPRHFRALGWMSGIELVNFGDVTYYHQQADENDGLWTSMYLASQVFRYAVVKDPEIKKEAWKSFEALEFLNNVTGIQGLMARSAMMSNTTPSAQWHNSSVYEGWIWLGDTSSDEVTGHMFVYPLVYKLLAETEDEKSRALRLISNIMNYIVDNDYQLIDITGKPTTWGRWNPNQLNNDPLWYDDRGVDSMQILSWLATAYKFTNETKFLNSFNYLVNGFGYGINIINLKITQPSDDNYSDDELTFLPYFTYIFTELELFKENEFQLGIDRTWNIVNREKPSLWNIIYGTNGAANFHLEDAIWTLQTWPVSQVNWPTMNSNRLDLTEDPDGVRNDGAKEMVQLIPYDERDLLVWNGSPYVYNDGNGFTEAVPTAYLLPYWMARYYNFISDETNSSGLITEVVHN